MEKVTIKIKRFDRDLPLPKQYTDGAACLDLYSRTDVQIAPQSFGYIPLNVAVEVPPGHWVLLAARSSLHKYGLIPGNGIGIIDRDFCGEDDEYQLIVFNVSGKTVAVERGQRVAQITLMKHLPLNIKGVLKLNGPTRGGIGSTGNS